MADNDELQVSALVSTSVTDDIAPMAHVNEHPKTLPLPGSILQNKESEFNFFCQLLSAMFLAFADD